MGELESGFDRPSPLHAELQGSPTAEKVSWVLTHVSDDLVQISIAGAITEETDFGPLAETIRPETRIDLSGVTEINSCGVREWMEFVEAVEQRDAHLVLEKCAPCMVIQLNLVSNFTGAGGRVLSILAPYACEDCEHEQRELLSLDRPDVEPTECMPCPKCGGELYFEELPQIYLQFHRESFSG